MSKESKGKGWFEDKNPLTDKAPVHQEVARKKEFEKQGFTGATTIVPSMSAKDDENIVTLHFNIEEKGIPKFTEASKEYMKKNNVVIETEAEGDKVTVNIPIENVEDFVAFLDEKGFELEDEEEKQIEEIIENGDAKTAKEVKEDSNENSSK